MIAHNKSFCFSSFESNENGDRTALSSIVQIRCSIYASGDRYLPFEKLFEIIVGENDILSDSIGVYEILKRCFASLKGEKIGKVGEHIQ